MELRPGDVLEGVELAGGGYGSPLERDPEHVREDVLEGYASLAHAHDVYGVVFSGSIADDSLAIEVAATVAAREALRMRRAAQHEEPQP